VTSHHDTPEAYAFDRFLRHDELVAWLEHLAGAHPALVAIERYGRSYEGRDLLVVTVTDASTGSHDTKPAHWVDASVHAVELTATVAACHLLQRLVDGFEAGDETIVRALRTRTFYVVPRVNPDGAEWALADPPRLRRSSVRPWPYPDAHRWPGHHVEDVDGDGRILQMRIADPNGAWTVHPDDLRLLVPIPPQGPTDGRPRYRVFSEGTVDDHDGFTVPVPHPPEGLDLNRNYPAGWSPTVRGSGDHPLSEPEIDALVRAIAARPNVCGVNAYHTYGGVLLRPSSTRPDSELPPLDVWVWQRLAEIGADCTGYPSHSVYEDFTWDRSDLMSGASDDWAYEHLGVYGWTTEFWDPVHAATGRRMPTHQWFLGPTDDDALAVLRWFDDRPTSDPRTVPFVDWYAFDHPQLGRVELGGWNRLHSWVNPPADHLRAEVTGHADFAIAQALASPRLEILRHDVEQLGADTWRVGVGIANTGWLPTTVTEHAAKLGLVRPVVAELSVGAGTEVLDGPARRRFGQLQGASAAPFSRSGDGTPDRVSATWTVRAAADAQVTVSAEHPRAGRDVVVITLRQDPAGSGGA